MTDTEENLPPHYLAGCRCVYEVVEHFRIFGSGDPEIWFPPREILLAAGLDEVGPNIARNDVARDLVARVIDEAKHRGLPECPTFLMFRVAIEMHEIPVTIVQLPELKLKNGRLYARGKGGARA